METNVLYYGDNLDILRKYIDDESVDLIYIDPPFNSKQAYNVIFSEPNGTSSRAQIQAFEDTWHWTEQIQQTYFEIIETATPKVVECIRSFRSFLGEMDMMAYLTMMTIRLIELHRVLKPTGSFYLHCDPTASHYLKVILDHVFGVQNFRNEIVWRRTAAHSDSTVYGNIHDIIFYYSKSDSFTHNTQHQPYPDKYLKRFKHTDENGRRFLDRDLTAGSLRGGGYEYEWNGVTKIWRCPIRTMQEYHNSNRLYYTRNGTPRLKQYLDEMPGVTAQDVWTDIPPINSQAKERLGYPTQKPEALLERIIKASSNEGDVVLDAFCGCGTAIAVAERLKRRWIGIDSSPVAIQMTRKRIARLE